MPHSYTFFKQEVKEWIKSNIPKNKRILDVGAGEGTYATLLKGCEYDIDAVEVWKPYIDEFKLCELYGTIYNVDIRDFDFSTYDFIILGDILEHLTREDGMKLISNIAIARKQCLVAIPYMMPQDGDAIGNPYETHLQSDLTKAIMGERYPTLECIYANQYYGYYVSKKVLDKAFVLYATEQYFDIVSACVQSLHEFSKYPIFVYMLNSNLVVPNATTIRWNCDIEEIDYNSKEQFYINRVDDRIYNILIQRPLIAKDCLKYANLIAYVDCDSIATPFVDNIFDFQISDYPLFTQGIYDIMQLNGKGDLEVPICNFLGIDYNTCRTQRPQYRQTGYFLYNYNCIEFLEEWANICNHLAIKEDFKTYAPYHEETIANGLLWKYNYLKSLPLIYCNASLDKINNIYNEIGFNGEPNNISMWFKIPSKKENLLFLHGEKRKDVMYEMITTLKNLQFDWKEKPIRILFLMPHTSTGGMPSFVYKRMQSLLKYTNVEVFAIEYENYGKLFDVFRNKMIALLGDKFYDISQNKSSLIDILNTQKIDIVHIDGMAEELPQGDELKQLYDNSRKWRIVETCHNSTFRPNISKRYFPDMYAFCTPYHESIFKDMDAQFSTIVFPIENNLPTPQDKLDAKKKLSLDANVKHILNVGLWTNGKNQGEGLEIARKYPHMQFHFVGNQAGNFQSYWQPLMKDVPPNVTIWGERNDVDTFMKAADVFMFNSLIELNPIVLCEAISYNLPIVARNLAQYGSMYEDYLYPIDVDLNTIDKPKKVYDDANTSKEFANEHILAYKKLLQQPTKKQEITITQKFSDGAFLEILGASSSEFLVEFFNENLELGYKNTIKSNCWVKVNRQYFTKWTAKVWENNKLIYENTLDLTLKKVYISFESSSLGDTIAWMPYCLEFKKKHNCKLIVSTFHNNLFDYPEIEFVNPNTTLNDIYATYRLGWFYDNTKEPKLPNTVNLQECATNILGLEYKEIAPKLKYDEGVNKYGKYVTIATNSTSGCKFWTREGWQELINYLHKEGYKVINTSKENNPFDNCSKIDDISIENTISVIHHSKLFIGLSSGLSWLSWAIGTKVVMISNFTLPNHEFQSNCIRVINDKVCNGCWNNPNFKFEKGDWDWCPIWKNTPRHFECHKLITAPMIIDKIKDQL
jgi:autotransporter strand-loop-strand O-heptosyltransferase